MPETRNTAQTTNKGASATQPTQPGTKGASANQLTPERPQRRGHASGSSGPQGNTESIADVAALLKEFFSFFQTSMTKFTETIVTKLSENVEKLTSKVFDLELANAQLKVDMGKQQSQIESLTNLLKRHDHKLKNAETKENDNEQYSRKSSVRVFGLPPAASNEDPKAVVCKVVNDMLHLQPPLSPSSIDIAHRVGPVTAKNTQTMICKFLIRTEKNRVMKERKELRKTGITITDDMTKMNLDFMKILKERADVHDTWFTNGKVFINPKNSKAKLVVRLNSDIDTIIKRALPKQ